MAILHMEPPVILKPKKIRHMKNKFNLPYSHQKQNSYNQFKATIIVSHKFINILYNKNLRQSTACNLLSSTPTIDIHFLKLKFLFYYLVNPVICFYQKIPDMWHKR